MIVWLAALAFAGDVFYADAAAGGVRVFDTRNLTNAYYSPTPHCVAVAPGFGMAFDETSGRLWMFQHLGAPWNSDRLGWVDVNTGQEYCPYYNSSTYSTSMSFDPGLNTVVGFEAGAGHGMWDLFNLRLIQDTGIVAASAADWFEPGGYHLVLGRDGFFAVDGVTAPTFLAAMPADVIQPWSGEMAWDADTGVLWLFEYGYAWGIDPTNWTVVAEVASFGLAVGGAGSIDDVPNQTPELLVSGVCPGTVYVTAVDATPGGHVRIASGTRRGVTSVPSGNCQGAPVGLANPRARVDLVANSAGIAATRIQATPGMCGQVLLQALDVDSCLTTSVGTVPAP
jgi:hypothetical protein